jgi:hypothetical protein
MKPTSSSTIRSACAQETCCLKRRTRRSRSTLSIARGVRVGLERGVASGRSLEFWSISDESHGRSCFVLLELANVCVCAFDFGEDDLLISDEVLDVSKGYDHWRVLISSSPLQWEFLSFFIFVPFGQMRKGIEAGDPHRPVAARCGILNFPKLKLAHSARYQQYYSDLHAVRFLHSARHHR